MANGWDSATLKKLKAFFERGLSTAEIGRKLGISKNAVVGKINRLGWNAAKNALAKKNAPAASKKTAAKPTKPASGSVKKTVAKKEATKTTKTDKPAKVAKKVATPVTPAVKTASKKTKKDLAVHQRIIQHSLEMANLKPNQCRWPIGDPDSEHFHFCGATVFTGKPYCYEHCRQAYQFTPPKKKQA